MSAPGRDQVAAAIFEVLAVPDVEDFVQTDWADNTTADVMRALVKIGALPAECDPDRGAS